MKINDSYKIRNLMLAALFAGMGLCPHAAAQVNSYLIDLNNKTAIELENLGGGSTRAVAINDTGQVAGSSTLAPDVWHAFITAPDGVGMRDLGNLGEIKDYEDASAHGINGGGQVVGFTSTSLGERRAFITDPDGVGMRHLGPMDAYLFANDINDFQTSPVFLTSYFRPTDPAICGSP